MVFMIDFLYEGQKDHTKEPLLLLRTLWRSRCFSVARGFVLSGAPCSHAEAPDRKQSQWTCAII